MKNNIFTPWFFAFLVMEMVAVTAATTTLNAQDGTTYNVRFQAGLHAGEEGGAFSLFQGGADLDLGDAYLEFNAQMADRHGSGQRIVGFMISPRTTFFCEKLRVEMGIGAAVHHRSVTVTDLSKPIGSDGRERSLTSMTAFQFRTKLATKAFYGESMLSISPYSQYVQAELGGFTKKGLNIFAGYNSVAKKMIGVRKMITYEKVALTLGGAATISNEGNGMMLSITTNF